MNNADLQLNEIYYLVSDITNAGVLVRLLDHHVGFAGVPRVYDTMTLWLNNYSVGWSLWFAEDIIRKATEEEKKLFLMKAHLK